MIRSKTVKNLYDKKHETFDLTEPYAAVMGNPTTCGFWMIYGKEKNGKTTAALQLANTMRQYKRSLYVSGEEGLEKEFIDAMRRAGIPHDAKNINFIDYEPVEMLQERLDARNPPGIVFIDNTTVYADELKRGGLLKLKNDNPDTLFVFIAHEEKGEPYTATAKTVKKLAKIIMHVKGLAVTVSGRCPGGIYPISEEGAALYHGQLSA